MRPYVVATAAVLVATFGRSLLGGVLGLDAPLLLFTLAVVVAGWVGGLKLGLLATTTVVIGLVLFVEPIGPPVDPAELECLAVDTRAPYTRGSAGPQGGKPAHYMLRWVNSRGETAPWSETATATTIGA